MSLSSEQSVLRRLARMYGVQTAFYDVQHRRLEASAETLMAVLRALGAPIERMADAAPAVRSKRLAEWSRMAEPVAVAWDGNLPSLGLRIPLGRGASRRRIAARMILEGGEERSWGWQEDELPIAEAVSIEGRRYGVIHLPFEEMLPPGYHRLRIERGSQATETLIIAAPTKADGWRNEAAPFRAWGVFLPLYALHTNQSWGAGDLGSLEALLEWVTGLGGGAVATLPLLPTFLDKPFCPSPYSPVTRLLWSEFYVDVLRSPEIARCLPAQELLASAGFQGTVSRLRQSTLVDYRRQMALKRRVLELLAGTLFERDDDRREAFEDFVKAHPAAADYAAFRACMEKRGGAPWRSWPERLRLGKLKPADGAEEVRRYYLYAQWLAHEQMSDIAALARERGVGLFLDFPLGVHRDGYDAWRYQRAFIPGASSGAPPDAVFTSGQNWGTPPLHPNHLRDSHYEYLILCLRHHLENAGLLRMDHVMGLHRLWVIPEGLDAAQGAYVQYPAEELYAILSLEAFRSRALIVGEDLGTVPPQVRTGMARHGLYRTYVIQYELDSHPERVSVPTRRMVAGVNTHDMPPFRLYWKGRDIEQRWRMGLFDSEEMMHAARSERRALRRSLRTFLEKRGFLADRKRPPTEILGAILRFLGRSASPLVIVNLEDLWGETEPQNIPGTENERPNWRRKARFRFEDFRSLPSVTGPLNDLDRIRREGPA